MLTSRSRRATLSWTLLPGLLLLLLASVQLTAAESAETSSAKDVASAISEGGDRSATGFWPWVLFGRFHVITVHFPIALLAVVLLLELMRLRRPRQSDATLTIITVLAAISAVVVTVMGWSLASHMSFGGGDTHLVYVHRWLGVITACLAVVVAGLAIMRQLLGAETLRVTYLITLLLTTVGVSVTGHYGGMLVHGESYLPDAIPWLRHATVPVKPAHTGPVTFDNDIQPIFEASCYKCHDADDQKGDLRMDTRKDLLAGGKTGPGMVPGDSAKSLILQRVQGLGGKKRMPKNKPPLTPEQIDLIARWIDAGAPWSKP